MKEKISEYFTRENIYDTIKKIIWIAVGQFILAIAFNRILLVNDLVASGFGGLVSVINRLTGWNMQVLLICLAVPIFIWSSIYYEFKQIIWAIYSYFMFTFYVGVVGKIFPAFHTDIIIATIIGGAICGFANAIVLKQHVSNGPEAVIALYLKEKFGISFGNFFLVLNTAIIFSSILYGNLTMIMYSLIMTAVRSFVTDKVVVGGTKYYNVNVMSDHYLDVADFITKDLKRGVTFIQAMDTTTMKKKIMMETIVTKMELLKLRDYIASLKDDTLIYANRSTSLLGRGFNIEES